MAILHQVDEPPLAQDRVADIQAGKLNLVGSVPLYQLTHKPVIEGTIILKLKGTDRMGNMFNRI